MPALIQTAPRSAPPKVRGAERRSARSFITQALGSGARIMADELQNIRAFGSETEMKQLMTEVARRQFLIKNDFELTKENWRLGAIQGVLYDADGSVIYDWGQEFSQAQSTEINWDLQNVSPASGALRLLCNDTIRWISRKLLGVGGTGIKIYAACGDAFWDAFTTHPEVRQTYINWPDAMKLRNEVGKAWDTFDFGNITWFNYRSTDDANPTSSATGTENVAAVGIASTRAKFFPANAGIFHMAHAPAPRFEFVNTPGLPTYSWIVLDEKRDMWADIEMFSYPLAVCTMPSALVSGKRTAAD